MQIIEYPVSLVMKAWHLLLATLGVDGVTAWPWTIALLVVTVRLILVPLAWRAQRSTRLLVNLRPALAALEGEYRGRTDRDSVKEKMRRRREMQQDGGYRVRDGCLPALVQIPFFLGLYRILLTVSRPTDLENDTHSGIGALDGTDVGEFLRASVFGVPMPSYVVMPDARLDFLGTTSSEVLHAALPLCLVAAVFTTTNTLYSVRRSWITLDVDNTLARGLFRVMVGMVVIVFVFPLVFGLAGPAPVAILFYWVMNNLWTLVQNICMHRMLDRTVPYSPEYLEFRRVAGVRRKNMVKLVKAAKKESKKTGVPVKVVLAQFAARIQAAQVAQLRAAQAQAAAPATAAVPPPAAEPAEPAEATAPTGAPTDAPATDPMTLPRTKARPPRAAPVIVPATQFLQTRAPSPDDDPERRVPGRHRLDS